MALRFHKQAIADLQAAREEIRPGHYHVAVFLAEQAAEKDVKAAYWHLLGEQPPSTHSMARQESDEEQEAKTLTGGIAQRTGGIPDEVLGAMSQLQASLEVTRYPSNDVNDPIPAEMMDQADATEAVAQAETVMKWVESLLQLPIGRPKRRKS